MLRFLPREAHPPTQEALAALHPYTGMLARLLYARGVRSGAQAEVFLHPGESHLHDPFLLHGMEKAVALLLAAKEEKTPTVVYGDYDVDGMCAAAITVGALRSFGVEARGHIPLREEGYGLNMAAVERLSQTCKLLITVDLGITNHKEVRRAQELGMTVIVTDHHQLSLEESPANAVVTPLLKGYPCPRLCGAGVALKLAEALLGREAASGYLDLASLATVADIVPLTGENRAIVALGLPKIAAAGRQGLRALLEVSGGGGSVDSYTLGFQLAPRLNAAGRLWDANQGLRLLMTEDGAEADALAEELNALNTRRREMENQVLAQAEEQAQAHDFARSRALIVMGEGWHVGVIGLVAGRLCKRYACPTAALSLEGGVLHGSLRSVPGVNIHHCLQACDDLLLRYGGHEQAAGVTLVEENYQAFCQRLQQAVQKAAQEDAFVPRCEYDLPLNLADATLEMAFSIQRLAPFGCDNPPPLFLVEQARLARRRACGAGGAHLQLALERDGHMLEGIAFGMGALAQRLPEAVDAVVSLKADSFRGVTAVKCEAEALRPAEGAAEKAVANAEEAEFTTALLAHLTELYNQAREAGKPGENLEEIKVVGQEAQSLLPPPARGVLYVAHTRKSAGALLESFAGKDVALCWHTVPDTLCFPTLLLCPRLSALKGFWRTVVLLDGEILSGEAGLWQARCPEAEVFVLPPSRPAQELAASIDAGDEAYRGLYRLLRANAFASLPQTARAAGMTTAQTQAGLTAFAELKLVEYRASPFAYTLLPPVPCSLGDSPTLAALRAVHSKGV